MGNAQMLKYFKKNAPDAGEKLAVLYSRYHKLMLQAALNVLHDRFLAEDAVQDAFFYIAKNMEKIGSVDARETKRYLIVAAKNASIDIYRKRGRRMEKEISFDEMQEYREEPYVMEPDVENGALEVLKNLPAIYRDVFLLKYSSRMENREIAGLLGISESAVRQRIARGKKMVQDALDRMEGA